MASKKIYVTHDFQTGAKIKLNTESSLPAVAEGTVVYDGDLRVSDDSEYKRVVAGSVDSNNQTVIVCEEFN
tara:strand:- start:53 stop:265 length:213 start_codon:yes stop_codon:yes gene_type:complete